MDATASAITIVSSVWTLTIYIKRLIAGIRDSEEKIKEFERKTKSFTAVIAQIGNAYASRTTARRPSEIDSHENEVRKHIQDELSRCKEEFKTYEEEVQKLSGQRKTGRYGVGLAVNTWREKVASPMLERIEKSIADHQSCLQSLMEVHNGHRLQETQDDLKQVRVDLKELFEKIESLARSQGAIIQDSPVVRGLDQLQERTSDASALGNAPQDTKSEEGAAIENESSLSLHNQAQDLLRDLLNSIAPGNNSEPLPPGQSQVLFDPSINETNSASMVTPDQDFENLSLQSTNSGSTCAHGRKPSVNAKGEPNSSTPMMRSVTQSPPISWDFPLVTGSPRSANRVSASETSGVSILVEMESSDCIDSEDSNGVQNIDEDSVWPLSEDFQNRTDTEEGVKLLEFIASRSKESEESVESERALQNFMQSDATLEEKDDKSRTPLMLAVSFGKLGIVEKLLANGADIRAKDNKQATVLHYAVEKKAWSVMSALLRSRNLNRSTSLSAKDGTLINATNKSGRTPLHCCTSLLCSGDEMKAAAADLIAYGADINVRDGSRNRPVYYAIKDRRPSVVELFLDKGAVLDFDRPGTSHEISLMLDDQLAGKRKSPMLYNEKKRRDSMSPQSQKISRFSFQRRRSSAATT